MGLSSTKPDVRQAEWTKLTAGCGHATAARLSIDAEQAGIEIMQLTTNDCIPCAKAKRVQFPRTSINDVGARG